MRRGVTLFITLSIIAAMLALVGVVFHFLETARAKAEVKASLIQANLLYSDTKNALRRLLGKTPKTSTYTTFYNTPLPIASTNGEFGVMVHCSPIASRPNIAWLALDGHPDRQAHFEIAQKVYDFLVDKADLKNPTLLYDALLDALKNSHRVRYNILSNINKKKGTISYREFQSILRTYRYEADDPAVLTLPWQTYFAFGTDLKRIDSNFIAPEVLAVIFDIDLQLVKGEDGFAMGSSLKDFLENNGLDTAWYTLQGPREVFVKQHPVDAMRCTVNYGFRDSQYAFRFDYIHKKVEGFEFLGH